MIIVRALSLVFILMWLVFSSFAQKMHITDSSNSWTTFYSSPTGDFYSYYSFGNDSIVNGHRYRYIHDNIHLTECLIREDTFERKVYFRFYHPVGAGFSDTAEHLVYDYNLRLGDTFYRRSTYTAPPAPALVPYIVTGFDSVVIQSTYHKVWHFTAVGSGGAPPFAVIEGIGTLQGPTLTFNTLSFVYEKLVCFRNSNGKPLISPSVNSFANIGACSLGLDEPFAGNAGVRFPNPINNESKVQFDNRGKGKLIIWNVLGQEVYTAEIEGVNSIPIGRYIQQPGVYYYKFVGRVASGMKLFTGTFIRE